MKTYMVFKDMGSCFSPIRKYTTNNLENARTFRNLLEEEDKSSTFYIVEIID